MVNMKVSSLVLELQHIFMKISSGLAFSCTLNGKQFHKSQKSVHIYDNCTYIQKVTITELFSAIYF